MDDRKIETLLTTIRKGSFSKAAEELSCTQSAVTQAMNSIEAELGFKVLERNHNGIRLTQKGEEILPFIIEVDSALRNLSGEAAGIAAGKTRPIRIGAFSSIANTWLPEIIKNYQSIVHDSDFEISIGTTDMIKWMLEGEIDMALGEESVIKAFRWFPLYVDSYFAVVPDFMADPDKSSITQEELLEHNLLLGTTLTIGEKLKTPAKKQTLIRNDDDYVLVNMVSQGLGVTIIPELSLKSLSQIPDNVVILDIEPSLTRTLGMGVVNNPSRAVLDFATYLRENFK